MTGSAEWQATGPLTPGFDDAHFRTVLGHFGSGVAIITSLEGDEPVGMAVQSFSSLSLDPPYIMFAPAKTSTSWPRIQATGRFCANVLSEDQEPLSRSFAVSGGDKFAGVAWHRSGHDTPILDGVLAWIDCVIETEHDAGDHTIVVGRVLELDVERHGRPLLFFRGGYGRLVD
jgi:3-hydroxy-9,10-secoandrosta-1,3,5(10)-triene-9,17-dione monooxygenase reductase component